MRWFKNDLVGNFAQFYGHHLLSENSTIQDMAHLDYAQEAMKSGNLSLASSLLKSLHGRHGPLVNEWLDQASKRQRYQQAGSILETYVGNLSKQFAKDIEGDTYVQGKLTKMRP